MPNMPKVMRVHPARTAVAAPTTARPSARAAERSQWPGKIEVSSRAIATVAGRAVAECYGVVGMAARRSRFGIVEVLPASQYSRAVEVRFSDDHVTIDVHVVLEHGLRITEIAHNIMSNVKFAVERTLGLRVVRVNVNVQALRVSGGE